jgi:rare lipoprotein A
MPEGRPYDLGNTQADHASINATSELSASSRTRGRGLDNPRAVAYEDDSRYVAPVSPVSAYAPIDPNGPREILSGRGLY